MANNNFVVHNGLTVGPFTVFAGNGDIITTGNLTVGNLQSSSSQDTINANEVVSGNITVAGRLVVANVPLQLNDVSITSTKGISKYSLIPLRSDYTSINNIMNVVDSKDFEVICNGIRYAPYVAFKSFPWITTYDRPIGKYSFRVVNTGVNKGNLILYALPAQQSMQTIATTVVTPYSGSQIAGVPYSNLNFANVLTPNINAVYGFVTSNQYQYFGTAGTLVQVTIRSQSSAAQVRKYPYTASSIALGD